MKANVQHFFVIVSCYHAVQGGSNSTLVDEILVHVTIQMKAIEQYPHLELFIMLYKVILTFAF